MSRIPVIIPAYEPDERLLRLLEELREAGVGPVFLVDDGSGPAFRGIFEAAEKLIDGGGKLLTHDVNRGKGRALKTAFRYVLENDPDAAGAVTADSDGQHTPESIIRVIRHMEAHPGALVLGVRRFDGASVPWKSRFGNTLTEKLFSYVAGVHVSDTQTGLRGIPADFMRELLDLKGERFEFEMGMLLEAAGRIPIEEVSIPTVYDSKEHHQTHFHPLKDSVRVYRILGGRLVRFVLSSLSASVLDLLLFSLFCRLLKGRYPGSYAALSTVAARILSASFNCAVNYRVVFRSETGFAGALLRYALLAAAQMSCSALAITLALRLFPGGPELLFKIIIDTTLFFISYRIQQRYVFGKRSTTVR